MAYGQDRRYMTRAQAEAAQIDVGLRQYMLQVYNYMASGLALTGIVAYLGASTGFYAAVAQTPFIWLVVLAPLGAVFFLSFRIQAMSFFAAQAAFWVFSVLMGLSLSYIFLRYTGASIARVFFISAGTFAAMSLYGYTTRRDLTGMGTFLFMGVIGLIIAMVVNIFLASPALQFAISAIGVLVFAGLTAYDTQQIKEMYFEGDDTLVAGRKAIMGALRLYLDFINMFMFLLQFLGNRE